MMNIWNKDFRYAHNGYCTEHTKEAQSFTENTLKIPPCPSVKTPVYLRVKKKVSKTNNRTSFNPPRLIMVMFLFIFTSCVVYSQTWSLQDCIDTALQNNLSLQSARIKAEINAVQLKNSKQNFLPSANANVVHGYNWGQTIDLFTNEFATHQVMYDNFYLSSSLVLFSGLSRYYTVKKNAISVKENKLNRLIAKRNVKIDVAAAYLQVLINQAIQKLANNNLKKTKNELNRIQSLFSNHQATKSDVSEIKAQFAQDKFTVLKAKNDVHYAKLLLKQLLNIKVSKNFKIQDTLKIVSIQTQLNDSDLTSLPEIEKAKLDIQKQKFAIKSLKGNYYPSLILSGSLGTGYSGNDKVMTPSGQFETRPFSTQIQNNLYQSISLTLSIPIFNRNANKNQIKIQELQLKSLAIDKKKQTKELRQKIEQIILDIHNTSAQLQSLREVVSSALQNYQDFKIRYENGDASYTELTDSKNKLFQAKSKLIQARYQLRFKRLVLSFYGLE